MVVAPVHHHEDRIRDHIQLCWLALLLIRVIENTTLDTWRNTRRELDHMHLVTFTTPHGKGLDCCVVALLDPPLRRRKSPHYLIDLPSATEIRPLSDLPPTTLQWHRDAERDLPHGITPYDNYGPCPSFWLAHHHHYLSEGACRRVPHQAGSNRCDLCDLSGWR
jgi:hypothetical protein